MDMQPSDSIRPKPIGLSALREITQSLAAAVDLETTLDLIAQKTTDVMHVDSCTVYLLEADGETLRLKATTGLQPEMLGMASLRVGEGMTGMAVELSTPLYAENARENNYFKYVDRSREEAFQSLLAIPLILEGAPIGALNVQTKAAHQFEVDEIQILSLIGDVAAGALAKAQAYDAQKAQLDDLRGLARVSEVVTSPQYLDDMLDIVTDMAARTMNAAVCSLFLLDDSAETLNMRSAKRVSTTYADREPIQLGRGVVGAVAAAGEMRYVEVISAETNFANPDLAAQEGLVSMLAVPLSVRDKVIGVIACYTDKQQQFSDQQVAFFNTLANQTALAIENTQLATRAAIVREMHHRIKNNLNMVAMLMQLQIPDAAKLDTRDVLETNIHRIQSIATVHDVLSEKGFRYVDVKDVLTRIARATVAALSTPAKAIKISVFGETISLPSQAATSLALVVNELTQNAIEHAFAGLSRGAITVSLSSSAEQIIVVVTDDGVGFPVKMSPNLGLEIAQTLVVEDLRGTIEFDRLDVGSKVVIRLPR